MSEIRVLTQTLKTRHSLLTTRLDLPDLQEPVC